MHLGLCVLCFAGKTLPILFFRIHLCDFIFLASIFKLQISFICIWRPPFSLTRWDFCFGTYACLLIVLLLMCVTCKLWISFYVFRLTCFCYSGCTFWLALCGICFLASMYGLAPCSFRLTSSCWWGSCRGSYHMASVLRISCCGFRGVAYVLLFVPSNFCFVVSSLCNCVVGYLSLGPTWGLLHYRKVMQEARNCICTSIV